jgi:hypothetical protein
MTPGLRERLCYYFQCNLPVPIGTSQGMVEYFLETPREPFIEHFPEALPGVRLKRLGQCCAL